MSENDGPKPSAIELERQRIAICFKALFGVKGHRNETQQTVMDELEKETHYKDSVFVRHQDSMGVSRIDVNEGIQRNGMRLTTIFIKETIKRAIKAEGPPPKREKKTARTS